LLYFSKPVPSVICLLIIILGCIRCAYRSDRGLLQRFLISNSPFKYLCGGNDPTAVLIHNFSSTITISKCTGSLLDPCSLLLETSIATTPRCMLPTEGNYDIHNLPPGGTQYDCEAPLIVHVN